MRRAFTIIELLVVVSIIALLVGILLPAINQAREQAKLTISMSNLRNLGVAHQSYASAFSDRQITLVNDSIASYGNTIQSAFQGYFEANGGTREEHSHPGPILGWGYLENTGDYVYFIYRTHETNGREEFDGSLNAANCALNLPISFGSTFEYFGSFRLSNVKQFYQYVGGKFYDETFYAPKDATIRAEITGQGFDSHNCFQDPGEYCDRPHVSGLGETPVWSSYALSPAAMFSPAVMAHADPDSESFNGWSDPWQMPGAYRSPSFSQCLYPAQKTHMLEHQWLQNTAGDCNPGFSPGSYLGGCEPYYFNHGWDSSPVTLFYDGHVGPLGVRTAMRADGLVRKQTRNENWGLWSKDTPFGEDGYLISYSHDQADTSFHVLTTDGIRGRDVTN